VGVEAAAGGLVEVVTVEGGDVLQLFFAGDVGGEFEGGGELAAVDTVEEVAVVDEEIGAAAVAVREDGERQVEAEGDHAADAAAVVAVDVGRIWRLLGSASMARLPRGPARRGVGRTGRTAGLPRRSARRVRQGRW